MKQNRVEVKRLLSLSRPYWVYAVLSLLLSLLSVALTLYAPILIGDAVNLLLGKGQVIFSALWPILLRLVVVVVVTCLAQWQMNLCVNRIAFSVVRDLRLQLFQTWEKVPLQYIDTQSQGDLLSRMVADVEQISEGLLLGLTQLFTGVITILGTLAFMLSINLKITLLVVVITPLSLFAARFIANRAYTMFQKQSETRGEVTAYVDEMVGNQKVVKAFGYEDRAQQKFEEMNQRLQKFSVRALFFSACTNPSTRFINGIVYAGVGVVGALFAIGGLLSIGQLTSFLLYANQYTKPFNEISGVFAELQSALACAKRVFTAIDTPPETSDAGAAVLQNVDGSARFSHVSFSYHPEKGSLISDFNLTVPAGSRVAIVGPTGSGKTTLINLLMRFYDVNAGEIRVSGHPITAVTRDSLRTSFGMVLQETWLKTGTVRENIAYGKPEATQREIEAAARAAYAYGFIRRLQNGFDTLIGEDGGNLSQGQKQLLCIARIMLCLPPMLILDEATSSIDTRTEEYIQSAFNRMMQGRTSFVVAHRLSTIRQADVILVLQNGNVIETGTHRELLLKKGFYAALYNSQFEEEEES